MSVQFGRCNLDDRPIDATFVEKLGAMISPYGPDGHRVYASRNTSIGYAALHTTQESRQEIQPHTTNSGCVLTWDGRLDNRAELRSDLRIQLHAPDVEIVSAAYDEWGTNCLPRLLGDWALTIWNPKDRSLVLAKDFVGIRPLFYLMEKDQITWSTILDPLVLSSSRQFKLNEEYLAGWLGSFPAAHLTPYVGIHSVPPSSFVLFSRQRRVIRRYCECRPGKAIVYRREDEYDEHFRAVFREAVRRRLRAADPVVAHLSGGMDSGSIVSMGDSILGHGDAEAGRLETLSFYDDSEPNWDERPYIAAVERQRGRIGFHVDVAKHALFAFDIGRFCATPTQMTLSCNTLSNETACVMQSQGSKVLLSGIGGDEVMGGVSTPIPELQDLIARFRFRELPHRLKLWALDKRVPWIHLFLESVGDFISATRLGPGRRRKPAPWLNLGFSRCNRAALFGYEERLKLFGPLPSFQANLFTLQSLRRQIGCNESGSQPGYETRFPYLDRDLLEFVYSVPRSQIVGPGRRRLLMRRALKGIVPQEILERKRKAFVIRRPTLAISSEWNQISGLVEHMTSASLGLIEHGSFIETLRKARSNAEVPLPYIMRTIFLEAWLCNLQQHRILANHATLDDCSVRSDTCQSAT